MPETLRGVDPDRLERSCRQTRDSIRFAPAAPGIERAEVFLSSYRFEPHRHDTYAVGITTSGVQTFRYRGEHRLCLPGQMHVLLPDELHDGAPGTEAGFGYRILYIAPGLVSAALGGAGLPFVPEPVHRPVPAVASLLARFDEPLGELEAVELAAALADALVTLGSGRSASRGPVDRKAVEAVREHLAAHCHEQTPAAVLERIAGLDRFTVTRQFRRVFGTSPDRYRTLRRLERARTAIERGQTPARAAVDAGFADQSHLTRQFKRSYGLTPGQWARLTAGRRAL